MEEIGRIYPTWRGRRSSPDLAGEVTLPDWIYSGYRLDLVGMLMADEHGRTFISIRVRRPFGISRMVSYQETQEQHRRLAEERSRARIQASEEKYEHI